jgi:hypothetical protein
VINDPLYNLWHFMVVERPDTVEFGHARTVAVSAEKTSRFNHYRRAIRFVHPQSDKRETLTYNTPYNGPGLNKGQLSP